MADQTQKLSLHTQVHVKLHPSWEAGPVDIIATSPEELFQTVNALVAGASEGNAVAGTQQAAPATQPAPQAQATQPATTQPSPQPQPTPQPAPTQAPAPTQSGPTVANAGSPGGQTVPTPAPAQAGTSQPSPTGSAEVGLPDVLNVARQLLQRQGGEDQLRQVLAQHGAEAVSSAPPTAYPAIKQGIEQLLAQ